MGLRFQRSMQLIPGVRLNFSKSGIGASFGVRGARYSISPNGRHSVSAGIPGTGLSWRQSASRGRARSGGGSYADKMAPAPGIGCMPVGVALVGLLIFLTGINTRPVDAGMIITGLAFAIPAIGIVLSRMRVAADHKGIEDKRATHDGRPLESDSDIPETLEEIIAEQEMYQPIWDAYLRAKRGEGGDMVEGMPLEADEVSFFVLRGEFFDPSKGLDSISGTVFVTNKRIVFDSIERSHEWPIAKLNRITLTGPGQRVFSVKGRSKKYGLLFPENVNDFDNAFGLALHLTNPQFSPEDPEPLMEEYFRKLAARRAELEAKNA